MQPPADFPGGRDTGAIRRLLPGPAVLLAFWFFLKASFDALVMVAARHGLFDLPEPTSFQVGWTIAEVGATLFVSLGLWERARWGWRAAVWLTFYHLVSGTASLLVAPPYGALVIAGIAYCYHGLVLFALASGRVRRDVFGDESSPWPRLIWAARLLLLAGATLLVRSYWKTR